jgi:hypothetical protein
MKKFKSLMLAALASAALAAPSIAADFTMTGEVNVGMRYATETPDIGDKTSTVQSTYIGDVNAKLTSAASETATYAFEFQKDDEGTADAGVNFELIGTATSGDNSIKAYGKLKDITNGVAALGYGDVYIQGGNKTLTIKAGKFGNSENYAGGMGYYRAATFPAGPAPTALTDMGNVEHITISDFRGLQVNLDAGDLQFELALPWMSVKEGAYALKSTTATATTKTTCSGAVTANYTYDKAGAATLDGYTCAVAPTTVAGTPVNAAVGTNVTGLRPVVKAQLGSVGLSATFYTLNFSSQDGSDTLDKGESAYQLMASVAAGAATAGIGYTQKDVMEDGDTLSPSTLNGYVKVALGGASNAGASFVILKDGTETDEATATQIAASYDTPFFVENVTLKLGVGTTTQVSDNNAKSGSSSGIEAEWAYTF